MGNTYNEFVKGITHVPQQNDANISLNVSDEDIAKLKTLSEKKINWVAFNAEETLFIKQATEKVNALKSKNDAKELAKEQNKDFIEAFKKYTELKTVVIKESKAEVKELKLEKDEEKAIAKYLWLKENNVDDINLLSAIDVLSKNNWNLSTKEDWEKAWYKAKGWIFGYLAFDDEEFKQLNILSKSSDLHAKIIKFNEAKLKYWVTARDLVNTKDLLANSKSENILTVLFDADSDWKVDKNDSGINNSKAMFDYSNKMIKDWKSTQLFSSISNIIWINVSNKEDLYKKLVEKPELKYEFIKQINVLSWAWDAGSTFVTDILEHWKDATRISMEKKKEANKYINSILETKKSSVNEIYTKSLEKFKNSLNADDKKKYESLVSSLSSEESKKSIFENFRLNWAGILLNLVEWHKWVWWGASFTNDSVNDFLNQNTENILKWLNFEIWVANFGWQFVPWIWMSVDLSKDLSKESRVFSKFGFINIIPYALAWAETQINAADLKKSWFMNLSDSANYAWATVNISALWWGIGIHYKKDQQKAIDIQEQAFNTFMDKFISKDGKIDEDFVKSQADYKENKDKYELLIQNVENTLKRQNFNSLSQEFKEQIIKSLKNSYTFAWRENMLKEAAKPGYNISWFGIWLEFIAGFIPIPVIGWSVSKVWIHYEENKISKAYAIIAEAKHVVIKTQITQNDEEITNSSTEISTGMDFIWNKALFRNFAQNHPKTWEHLVTAKWLSSDEEASLVLTMFKSDKNKNTKFFKEFTSKIETYKQSTSVDDKRKMNELIAWFYDISFADIRTTSEVIMGYTKKWDKYEGTFNFQESRKRAMERFASSEWLSSEFVIQNQMIVSEIKEHHTQELKEFKAWKLKHAPEIAQIKDPTLFALVASYKIDTKWHSLWKWFVDIPAGQANIADWKTQEIRDSKDINHLVEAFTKSSSWKNTMIQLTNTINTKESNFISSSDFVQLLEKWSITKNWKTVSLNREFVYFLYGQCANESMWLRIKWLKFEGFNTSTQIEEVTYGNIAPDWALTVQTNTTWIPEWVVTNYAFWITWGLWNEKKWVDKQQAPVNSKPDWDNWNNPVTPPSQWDQ